EVTSRRAKPFVRITSLLADTLSGELHPVVGSAGWRGATRTGGSGRRADMNPPGRTNRKTLTPTCHPVGALSRPPRGRRGRNFGSPARRPGREVRRVRPGVIPVRRPDRTPPE